MNAYTLDISSSRLLTELTCFQLVRADYGWADLDMTIHSSQTYDDSSRRCIEVSSARRESSDSPAASGHFFVWRVSKLGSLVSCSFLSQGFTGKLNSAVSYCVKLKNSCVSYVVRIEANILKLSRACVN